ncbi:MAG: sulfotransferase domain-containing protein [Proteobacteria bacterium]|nr:sulfotransferase domain-containing protein [Pseudomonadota bacterium]
MMCLSYIEQKNTFWWLKLNGLLRYALSHTCSGMLPLYIVNEYPKSGGSWVAQMLSEILEVPFPRNRLPMLRSSIAHGHFRHTWNMHNVVNVWRDGRDVMTSFYFHCTAPNNRFNQGLVSQTLKDLVFNDVGDVEANLPRFIEYMFEAKKHPRFTWAEHVDRWNGRPGTIQVTYEQLRIEPEAHLARVLWELTGRDPSAERVRATVERYSFENQTGRKPGQENRLDFLRKGIVGDWKNTFSREAREVFHRYAGAQLIALGYEQDDSWV